MYSGTQNTFQGSQKHLYIPKTSSKNTQKQFEKIMKNHIFQSFSLIRVQMEKICHFEVTHDSECDLGTKKRMKYQNNIRDVFRHTKFPLGNEMIHWNELLQSLLRILLIFALKMALNEVSFLINHTGIPYIYTMFQNFMKKSKNIFSQCKLCYQTVPSHPHRCTLIGSSILTHSVDFQNFKM